MALSTSTGLRNYVLDTGPARTAIDLGFINIYDGNPPDAADDAIGTNGVNTLLVTISVSGSGTGLTLEVVAADGAIEKNGSETWSGTALDTGTASFYRHVAPGDTTGLSITEPRFQGLVANAGAEMNMSDTFIILNSIQKIDFYVVNLPV